MSKPPSTIWLYRITHIQNLEHAIQYGLVTAKSENANPTFVNIGDSTLIDTRREIYAPDPPGGVLSDYIPFYLGPRSPMLLQIATGFEDVIQRNQEEIIYLISSLDKIKYHQLEYFFTDGHARSMTSNVYTSEEDFIKLDWDVIYATNWTNDATDLKRKEKKQAEFLVKNYMPWSCIEYVGVYNDKAKQNVSKVLENTGVSVSVKISPEKLYYDHL